jgi:hypothetical protein
MTRREPKSTTVRPLCCCDHARRLGCRKALKMDLIQYVCFHQLRLEDRGNHLYQRFVRED